MKCSNCGAKLNRNSVECPNCGYNPLEDEYLYAKYVKKNKAYDHQSRYIARVVLTIAAAVVVVAVLITGTYLFAEHQHNSKAAPELSFHTGTGIVNDEKVVYLTIDDSSAIEYILGVNAYSGEVTADTASQSEIISSDYEYTKNSSDSVRSIFFYAKDLGINEGDSYTFTFEMTFGFSMDVNSYTYYQPVSFSGEIKNDLKEIVFDHRMNDDIENEFYVATTEPTEAVSTTKEDKDRYTFVYDGYWYSEPRRDGNVLSIDVWKFDDNKAKRTTYTKKGNGKWTTADKSFKFYFDGTKSSVLGDDGESYNMVPDSLSITIEQKKNGEVISTLVKMNNKSIENVEDAFGM